jgi:hypothetical protein
MGNDGNDPSFAIAQEQAAWLILIALYSSPFIAKLLG